MFGFELVGHRSNFSFSRSRFSTISTRMKFFGKSSTFLNSLTVVRQKGQLCFRRRMFLMHISQKVCPQLKILGTCSAELNSR